MNCLKGMRNCTVFPYRYLFVVLAFFGSFHLYALSVNLSVAIVAMVNHTSIDRAERASATQHLNGTVCPATTEILREKTMPNGNFNWDGPVQGMVLGSFFYGYVFTCCLGGWLGHRFGGKYIFGPSVLIGAVLTLLAPLAARTHYGALIATRAIQGVVNGVCYPALQSMASKWTPSNERTKIVGFLTAGQPFGMVVTLALSGYLASNWGWASIFYLFGSTGCIWFALWVLLVYECPSTHPHISKEELQLFLDVTKPSPDEKNARFPWRKALTSRPFIAVMLCHFVFSWTFFTLMTNLPTYLNNVLHFDMESNGLLSASPYLSSIVLTQIASFISDWVQQKGYASTTVVRKVSHVTGLVIPSVCLVGVGFTCNTYLAMILLNVGVGLGGASFVAIGANFIDLSPQYSGILRGISQTPAMLTGFITPYVVGVVTGGPNGQIMENWRIVFYISAAMGIFGAIMYCLFGSGEEQNWEEKRRARTRGQEHRDVNDR
ncbi:sialin-like [Paramacrobiotus metropolitanus]|uniref:sialin-like n=1 Tax=Paramacrobiotus metropolitanus TaxID=2943436 RepID=UPI002445B851|nr:sialin-like [Paramacrobiotus metropolitanus]